jgi:uncharacterized protein
VSAFDDEFGLFGDEEPKEEDERRSTLGARRIASSETIIDDIELEEGGPPRRRGGGADRGAVAERPHRGRRVRREREPVDPVVSSRRAAELLYFLAQKLVSKPEAIAVQTVPSDRGPVLELEVDQEDIGKVIGRSGRVAQALRTLVRAGAEGKVGVEIIEIEDVDDDAEAYAADANEQEEQKQEVTDA